MRAWLRRVWRVEQGTLSLVVVLDAGRESRTLHLSYRTFRRLLVVAAAVTVMLLAMGVSWGYLAIQAARTSSLEGELARLYEQEERVDELAAELESVVVAYEDLRELFGPGVLGEAGDLWLPPSTGASSAGLAASEDGTPSAWPLTERGFVTRTPLQDGGGSHPGIDIAVPSGSYVRAAGGGTVAETGDDRIYGNYVVLDHGGGYRSLYGHASTVLAQEGVAVREREVIALSGSSGQSTAPHLHFEIVKDGTQVDPLTLVSQP